MKKFKATLIGNLADNKHISRIIVDTATEKVVITFHQKNNEEYAKALQTLLPYLVNCKRIDVQKPVATFETPSGEQFTVTVYQD